MIHSNASNCGRERQGEHLGEREREKQNPLFRPLGNNTHTHTRLSSKTSVERERGYASSNEIQREGDREG